MLGGGPSGEDGDSGGGSVNFGEKSHTAGAESVGDMRTAKIFGGRKSLVG